MWQGSGAGLVLAPDIFWRDELSKQQYSKSKGREAENAVVDYLRLHGFPAERRRLTGAQDCGDVGGIKGVAIEIKSEKKLNFAGYIDEMRAETENARARFKEPTLGFVVAKRRGTQNPGEWYAVLPLDSMVALLKERAARP